MSAHSSTTDVQNSTETNTDSPLPQKGELQQLIEDHETMRHRATIGGVEFATISTARKDESEGAYFIEDMDRHVRLYLGGEVPNIVFTEEQVEEEETAMEGERDAAPNTQSLVGAHALLCQKQTYNTSRIADVIELADGTEAIMSFRYIDEKEREALVAQ